MNCNAHRPMTQRWPPGCWLHSGCCQRCRCQARGCRLGPPVAGPDWRYCVLEWLDTAVVAAGSSPVIECLCMYSLVGVSSSDAAAEADTLDEPQDTVRS